MTDQWHGLARSGASHEGIGAQSSRVAVTARHALPVLVAVACLAWAPAPALACGGCFHPPPNPTGQPTAVTGHTMAVAMSPRGTTLWDRIQFSGSPDEFAWVLPVDPSARIELASEAFFIALREATQLTFVAPAPPLRFCPDPCDDNGFLFGSASAGGFPVPEEGGPTVNVLYEGVVGPYETVTIESDDPDALVTWLRDNGYFVPESIQPTIDYYTSRGTAFAALRLRPGAGVHQMQPVRVTFPGMTTLFPLRMVAAGVMDFVELELFVFAEGRTEAENFGNAEVDRAAIAYDWETGAFNYDELFDDARFAGEGPGTNWVTEFAGAAPGTLRNFTPENDVEMLGTSEEDFQIVLDAIDRPYLTRLRTELPPNELQRDLNLRASFGDDIRETTIQVTNELNRAPDVECPTYCAAGSDRSTRGVGCGVSQSSSAGLLTLLLLGGVFVAYRLRRR